jgi:hypothetical protein
MTAQLGYWYAAGGHPAGASAHPSFEVIGSIVYPLDDADEVTSRPRQPWYQYRGRFVYPVVAHPASPSPDPWFFAVDQWLYATARHPEASASDPWYRFGPA